MKILNTKSGKFGRFMRKNGAYMVLGLVVVATCVAVYAGTNKIKGKLTANGSSSQTNLNGDENKWNSNYQDPAQQTDTQVQSSSSSSQQQGSMSSSKPQNSSASSQIQSNLGASQEILFILPVNGKVLNKYSGNKPVKSKTMGDWRLHTGVDYACEKGTSVKASGEGTVLKIYNDDMWGTTVEIEHPNKIVTIYSSLSPKVSVEKGQKVQSGQAIGTVSNTAKVELSEQSHLHFAAKKDGKYINPESIITKPIGKE